MFTKRINSAIALAGLLALLLTSATARPAADGVRGIEGTWVVEVTLQNPPAGFPPSFTALETYGRGGGLVTTNNIPDGPGAGQGAWEKSGDEYAARIMFFTLDPNGVQNGSIKVSHRVSPAGDGTYSGEGLAEFCDTAGNVLFGVPFTSAGRRL